MPAPPIIRRVSSLKGLGVFRDYASPADLPDLQQHNLIYGFNRSGKTTLSRVFASLEFGAVRSALPDGGQFEVELTDGTLIKSTGELDALKGRLLVFNVDFIEDNLRWKDGTANPVFYLGKAQAELVEKLEGIEAVISELVYRTRFPGQCIRQSRMPDRRHDWSRWSRNADFGNTQIAAPLLNSPV